jgi:hypothetical protein
MENKIFRWQELFRVKGFYIFMVNNVWLMQQVKSLISAPRKVVLKGRKALYS